MVDRDGWEQLTERVRKRRLTFEEVEILLARIQGLCFDLRGYLREWTRWHDDGRDEPSQ